MVMATSIFEIVIIWIGLLFLFSALLMWLWNITITRIFGIREITFWEAFRFILIAGFLFGSFSIFKINL